MNFTYQNNVLSVNNSQEISAKHLAKVMNFKLAFEAHIA